MARSTSEAIVDIVAAMAEHVDDDALAEAYTELYQALCTLLLQEDKEELKQDIASFVQDYPTEKALAVRKALFRLRNLSPGDHKVIHMAVTWAILHSS